MFQSKNVHILLNFIIDVLMQNYHKFVSLHVEHIYICFDKFDKLLRSELS